MPQVAIVSTAHIHTRQFVEQLNELTGGPYIIWDDVTQRGKQYADMGNCAFEPDLDKVLDDDQVEGYLICAENTRHLPLLERVLPLGKPVMCEKPLATSTMDAQAIAALIAQHGTKLISGYFQPFLAHHRGVSKILAEGTLGDVTHAVFRNAHQAAYGRWFDNPDLAWFTDPALCGGGALLDMGTHAVHLLRHFFGPVEQVWAMCDNYCGAYPAVDDYGMIQMKFASGVMGRVEAAWVYTGKRNGLEIIGSKQTLDTVAAGELIMSGPQTQETPVAKADPKPTRVERLIAVIENELTDQELAEDLDACLDAVAIMDAAYASAKSGSWVDVVVI